MIASRQPLKTILSNAARASGCADEAALEEIVEGALADQRSAVDDVLDAGLVDEESFLKELGKSIGLTCCNKIDVEAAGSVRDRFPPQVAIPHRLLPLPAGAGMDEESSFEDGLKLQAAEGENGDGDGEDEETEPPLWIATHDPFDLIARQAVAQTVPGGVTWVLAPREKIVSALQSVYGVGADTFEELLAGRDVEGDAIDMREESNIIDADDDEEASVIKFVNQILREALNQRATDIHVEPLEGDLRIRYRIDGVLQATPVPERINTLQASVITRLKIMARLDIAEKRLPQDGRINLQIKGQSIDVRVATIPTPTGESVSLRLLGQEQFTIDRLNLTTSMRERIEKLLQLSNGIILVTGPTGCGKSTTLYTFLAQLNSPQRRIITIEDPIENKLQGVVQIAVKPEINLTFAAGLRSILRADPNVVMVGEIRDLETAEIAIRAALTGHLVFSTLHTNDAIGGIPRLIDMGVEPFLVSASVRAFMAQRLVRVLCPKCKAPAEDMHDAYLKEVGFPIEHKASICEPHGCDFCRGSGFHGRLAIYELCEVSKDLEDLIAQRAQGGDLRRQAMKDGMTSLRDYGWGKVIAGETTLEEVLRVTTVSSEDS